MRIKPNSFLFTSAFVIIVLCGTWCKKKVNELSKLPPITQEGKNTFGCLVNGKVWVPQGYNPPHSNFEVIVDPSDSLIDIRAFSLKDEQKTDIFFGSTITQSTGIFPFQNKGKVSLGIFRINGCYIGSNDSVFRKGNLKITKYDLQNNILSGEFDCVIYASGCTDTVRITNGRFDKKL